MFFLNGTCHVDQSTVGNTFLLYSKIINPFPGFQGTPLFCVVF